jgi:hypothetical protein
MSDLKVQENSGLPISRAAMSVVLKLHTPSR